jgi:hypothetical protein
MTKGVIIMAQMVSQVRRMAIACAVGYKLNMQWWWEALQYAQEWEAEGRIPECYYKVMRRHEGNINAIECIMEGLPRDSFAWRTLINAL